MLSSRVEVQRQYNESLSRIIWYDFEQLTGTHVLYGYIPTIYTYVLYTC